MVDSLESEQLRVCAQLDDALVDDGNLVGTLDGRQPVGDGHRRARLHLVELVQRRLHHLAEVGGAGGDEEWARVKCVSKSVLFVSCIVWVQQQ